MDIGTSLFLIAVGAILDFAVEDHVKHVDLQTVGVILMIVGGIGILLSLAGMGPWNRYAARRRYIDDRDVPPPRY